MTMIEFARLGLLIAVLAFSVQANERAKELVRERKAAKEARGAREAKGAETTNREDAKTQGFAKTIECIQQEEGAEKPPPIVNCQLSIVNC